MSRSFQPPGARCAVDLATGTTAAALPLSHRCSTLRQSSPRHAPASLPTASPALSARAGHALAPTTARRAALPCLRTSAIVTGVTGARYSIINPCQPSCVDIRRSAWSGGSRLGATRSSRENRRVSVCCGGSRGAVVAGSEERSASDKHQSDRLTQLPPVEAAPLRSIRRSNAPPRQSREEVCRATPLHARWPSVALAAAAVACVLLPLPLHLPPQHTPPAVEQGRAAAGSRSLRSAVGTSWDSARGSALAAAAPFSGANVPLPSDTLDNVPQSLSEDDRKPRRIQKPKTPAAEKCLRKCVGTCIRGGAGAPGEGPINVERPIVVFKSEFRSRQYCLVECSEICNLLSDAKSKP